MSKHKQKAAPPANTKRACVKTAIVLIATLAVVIGLSFLIDKDVLSELKHGLTLSTIILLLILINLISFLCFIVMFAAYQWIRRDLKPTRPDDIGDW